MSLYVVLSDFVIPGSGVTLKTGQKIDDSQFNLTAMQSAGLVAVAYSASMDAALAAFASHPNRAVADLFMLLTLSGIDVSGVIKSDGSIAFTASYVPAVNQAAATKLYVDQIPFRAVAGASDTLVVADIGGAVRYSGAAAVAITLPDLSAAVVAPAREMVIILEYLVGTTAPTITPSGAGVTLNGSTSGFTPPGTPGIARSMLTSIDGKVWTA